MTDLEMDALIDRAIAARNECGMETADIDIALGWITALRYMVNKDRINEDTANALRSLSAKMTGKFCAARLERH